MVAPISSAVPSLAVELLHLRFAVATADDAVARDELLQRVHVLA
jgi:hypothetical protein